MELPHIGNNCALKQCNRLDFLPVKCDACSQVFCIDHYKYDGHNCPTASATNNQVPMCPLCSEPVASKPNQLPDIAVSQHIDKYCKRNTLIKNPQAKSSDLHACCYKSCKRKDIIYLECSDCRLKFCIKHRHPTDHTCTGPSSRLKAGWQSMKDSYSSSIAPSGFERLRNKANQMTKSGQAALRRIAGESNSSTGSTLSSPSIASSKVNGLQGGLSEQEALAIALRESQSGGTGAAGGPVVQEDEDQALARALHESQVEAARNRTRQPAKDSCIVC